LALASIIIMIMRSKDIKAGNAPDDELSKKAGWKAGYYAYLSTVWVAVGVMWLNIFLTEAFGVEDFSMGQVIGAIVVLPGVVFVSLAMYFKGSGKVE